jgi:hypothetical protein
VGQGSSSHALPFSGQYSDTSPRQMCSGGRWSPSLPARVSPASRARTRPFLRCHRTPSPSFCLRRVSGGGRPLAFGASSRGETGLRGESTSRRRASAFSPQCRTARSRTPSRYGTSVIRSAASLVSALCASPRSLGGRSIFGRREVYSRLSCLRETYRDRLLCGACTVLPLANMVHLLANELAGLGCRGLALSFVALSPRRGLPFRNGHRSSRKSSS